MRSVLESADAQISRAEALWAAAARGHEGVARLLVAAGASDALAAARPLDGCTAAMLAAKSGHASCLRVLLEAGAATDATNRDGWSALMLACEADAAEAVGALLTKCMQVLFYRDTRACSTIQIGKVDATGSSISAPTKLETYWEHPEFIKGGGHRGDGSW